ncbi:MAG: DUF5677 domain-containing protein [Acidobacteria bacterium]|nr:DUF5677 domain-containing protein [Acidobacteriota bacterium]
MSFPYDLFPEAQQRYQKFERLFQAQNTLGDAVNTILDRHSEKLKVQEGEEHDLSLVVAAGLGKAIKTFQAITRLCLLGYGEDALILLRSNINLLINTAYIVADRKPTERVKDFLAFSYQERVKYLKIAHAAEQPPWGPPVPLDELAQRAKAWKDVSIGERAKVVSDLHYNQGYRFYSSLEHSDAFALNEYIQDWDEIGPRIGSEEGDKHVDIALVHSYGVVADLFFVACKYFGIDEPDLFTDLKKIWVELGKE